jgi:hypothetical protein
MSGNFLVHLDQRTMRTIDITWRPSFVVCKLFTFQAFSSNPLGQLEPNLVGMFPGWSSTKFLFFVLVGYSTRLPGSIICSDWLKFQRSSQKLMNWLNPNCKWKGIGMSFTDFLFSMPIGNPRWPPPQHIDYIVPYGKMFKCLLRNYKNDSSQTVHECSLDGLLQILGFLFRYEIQNGGYGRT